MKKMNEPEVIQIVETILPNNEDESNNSGEENGIISKCKPDAVIFQAFDDNGFIHAQHSSLVMTPETSNKYYSAYSGAVDARKQYSSTTIVGSGDVSENEMEVTTIHVLDLDEADGNMEVAYGNALQVPMAVETLEVPVGTMMTENDEVQSIHIGDYATVVSPAGTSVQEDQSMMIGNCFVTVQDNQVLSAPSGWNNESQLPTVKRVVQPRCPIGSERYVRFRRSRMVSDKHTSIPVSDFKAQLSDTSDIIGRLDLAPSSKKMMNHLSNKGFGKLFSSPGRKMSSANLVHLYTRHLSVKRAPIQEMFDDMVLLPLGYQREVDRTKIKRITRRRRYPEAEEYQRKVIQEQVQQTFDNLVADSQKSMEAVFLENSSSLCEEDQGNLQILVQAAENDSLEYEGRGGHSGRRRPSSVKEDRRVQSHPENPSGNDVPSGDWLGTVQQFIIIVPSDPLVDTVTETVITS